MNRRIKFRFLAIFSIIVLCIGCVYKTFQNDTFYIIKLGDYILNHGIDFKDHFSIHSGLSYFYPHWLYDVFVCLIYNNFGYFGIYVSVIITFIILALFIYFVNVKLNNNEFISFYFTFCFIPFISMFMVARGQSISYILFLLEVYFLEMLLKSGKNKYIFYLMIDCILIANVHATVWIFYFVLFLPYLFEIFIHYILNTKLYKNLLSKKFKFKISNSSNFIILDKSKYYKKIIIIFVISLFLGIFSFSKDIPYTYLFRTMSGNSQSYISEHFPTVLWENPQILVFMGLFLFVAIFTNTKIKLRDLCMILGLFVMSIASIRHMSFLFIIGNVYLLRFMMPFFETEEYTINFFTNLFVSKVGMVVIIILVCSYSLYKYNSHINYDYIDNKYYPVDATKYILDNFDVKDVRLFNEYNYGSYLLFYDVPVFIDSRCDLYTDEFNLEDYDIFDDYDKIMNNYSYNKYFKNYNISHVLLSKGNNLYKLLKLDDNYKDIYSDKYFILFERLDYEK